MKSRRFPRLAPCLLWLGILVVYPLVCSSAVILAQAAQTAPAQQDEIKARYTKMEQLIPMRDGAKLFTSIYLPRDSSQKYPFMMSRTPYSVAPYGANEYKTALGPSPLFMREGFIFVYQDVRGRNYSEGDFKWMAPYKPKKNGPADVDESTDTYDTIDWLVKNIPNNNGRVGIWGISYPGHYTAQAIIDAHPALKAASPQAPMADNYLGDDMHHNGTLFLSHAFNFLTRGNFGLKREKPGDRSSLDFTHGTPDGYRFFLEMGPLANANNKFLHGRNAFWNLWMEHGDYDAYWKAQNVPQHLTHVRPAVLTVGGWFDSEDLPGPLAIYHAVEKNNPKAWNSLVMGPWRHGGWARDTGASLGDISFGSNTGEYYQANIELPFFMSFLKGDGQNKLPEAFVFETGANQWRQYAQWPPADTQAVSLYPAGNGKLALTAPAGQEAYDEYISDPNKPVPFNRDISIGMTNDYMTDDQRHAATRPDVLVYEGDALAEDMTLAGPVKVDLYVSTTGTDADFVVKLIDVFPGHTEGKGAKGTPLGHYQMLIRGEPFRAKYRNGFDQPRPLKPGEVTHIAFAMPDINHTFKKGHRMMIQVQSTWFPLVDRNPQKFIDIYRAATEADFQKAAHRVHRGGKYSTRLTIQALKRSLSAGR
ncbi:MAG: CocE/NonD family hydrolase [Blastocatellia bacterium]